MVAEKMVSKSKAITRIPSSDDIEVLEIIDIENSSKPKPLFPESSSRKDLLSMNRACNKQLSMKTFLNSNQGKREVMNNKLSLKKRYVKLDSSKINRPSSFIKSEKVFNHQNNNHEENNVPNTHNGNKEFYLISKDISYPDDKIKKESKELLVNPVKPECPLVQIKLSYDHENEGTAVKLEACNIEKKETSVKKDEFAFPGTSAATKEIDCDVTSNYSKSLFEKFIDKWRCLDGYGGDDFLICDKLWRRYNLCHSTYTDSRKFCTGMNKAIADVNVSNKYFLIKDIMDTMKKYKDAPYIEKEEDPNEWLRKALKSSEKEEDSVEATLSDEDLRTQQKLKRLEKAMIKIHKEIQAKETEEVDLDDSENSSYLLLDRLKVHFMRLDEKYCKLANCSVATGRPVEKKFIYEGSRYQEINQRITAWVNKHREFPEYVDVLNLVKEVTKTNSLPMRPETVRVKAQEIFRDVGKMLKNRRQKDDMFSIYAYAGDELNADPADADPDLYKQLKVNEKLAKEKLDKVFNHYYEKDLEEREKTGTKIKKDLEDEIDANSKETKMEGEIDKESNLDKDKNDKYQDQTNIEKECLGLTDNNDKGDLNGDAEDGTFTEGDSIFEDEEEIIEQDLDSESEHNTDNPLENGRLSGTKANKKKECDTSKVKVKKSAFAEDRERISLDISDTSGDEEIETASNDSFLPKKELDTSEEEINGNLDCLEVNDVASECSEEDILIADSPDPLESNLENTIYRPVGDSNVASTNSRKRKLDLPLSFPKKSHIESSPEIVELD